MIKVEHVETWGFAHAIRGMRNPMNSWEKSDSKYIEFDICPKFFKVGENDLELMKQLYQAGAEHRKYLRQIFVSMDIVAPLYWWKQMDTYKVGVVSNSCSTMHTIMAKPFDVSDFSLEKAYNTTISEEYFSELIDVLNDHRDAYLNFEKYRQDGKLGEGFTKKDIFDSLIQILPSSYNQKRTITMNYENVFNIIHQREHHKLDEWKEFVSVLKELPYIKKIGGMEE